MKHLTAAALTAALLIAPSAAAATDRTPPCRSEDSPGRCVWDAQHRGNGQGRSFIAHRDGSLTFVGHKRAHRLAVTSA